MGLIRIFLSSLLLICIQPVLPGGISIADQHKSVMILNSYHSGLSWVEDLERGIYDVFNKQQHTVELFSEYMDTKRIPYTPLYEQQLVRFLGQKYKQQKLDAIIVSDNNAFDFIRRHKDLFGNPPIFFCGVNSFKDQQLVGHPNITGVAENFDAQKTLALALTLHPETQELFVVNDFLPTGIAWTNTIKQQLSAYQSQLNIHYTENIPLPQLEKKLSTLPDNSLVLLGVYFRDSEKVFYKPAESTKRITNASPVPVYGLLDFNLNHGIVGGLLISGYAQGQAVANQLADFLEGKPWTELPVVKSGSNRFMFDQLQLQRFGLKPEQLPAGSILINKNKVLLSNKEQQWLDAHPVIRLAPDPDYPPIEFFDKNNQYKGLAADYVSLIEKKLGIHFEIKQLANWDKVVKQARNHQIDMWGAASPTTQRQEYMLFTSPMFDVPGIIITRRDEVNQLSMENMGNRVVTVVSGYAIHDYIKKQYPKIKLDISPDIKTALRKVSFGQVDVMIADQATSTHYIEKEGISNLKVVGKTGYHYRWAFAVRKDWPELQQILQKGLKMLSIEEKQTIFDKWIRLDVKHRAWWQLTHEQIIVLIISAGLSILVLFMFWNRVLQQRVRSRTSELAISHKMLEESEEKYRSIFESSEYSMRVFKEGDFILTNEASVRLFGYNNQQELIGLPPWLLSPDLQPDGQASIDKAKEMISIAIEKGYHHFEWQHKKKDGTLFPADVSLTRIPYEGQTAVFCICSDISERKKAEAEIHRLATHDALTGLASLNLAQDRLNMAINNAEREKNKAAILFIDLDGFKQINDEYGHEAGDKVLKKVAQHLSGTVRNQDTVARIGGDEFLIILNGIHHAENAEQVAQKVIEALKTPCLYQQHLLHIGCSTGISIYPDHSLEAEALVKLADDAMYKVKRSGKNNYYLADSESSS